MAFDFIRTRIVAYAAALVLVLFSFSAPFLLDFNLGIDMTGGILIEYTHEIPVDIERVRTIAEETVESLDADTRALINATSAYAIAWERKFAMEIGFTEGSERTESEIESAKIATRDTLDAALDDAFSDADITRSRYVNIGESFGAYIRETAYLTLAIAIVGITLYIVYAFWGTMKGASSFTFALVTIATLAHDVIITFGLYLLASSIWQQFSVDTFFVTAMLTVLGYSINDTIVILDRIRANVKLPENKNKRFSDIVNAAVNDTLTRSLYTSVTVLFVLVALFFLGPDALSGFSLALIIGTIVGTYSSVFIAAPMLFDFRGEEK